MSFLTMRGWVNVFWGLKSSEGRVGAAAITMLLIGVGSLVLLNMLAAIVIQFIKTGNKYLERRFWLWHYPGNLDTVTELELVVWAKRNNRTISRLFHDNPNSLRSFRGLFFFIYGRLKNPEQTAYDDFDPDNEKHFENLNNKEEIEDLSDILPKRGKITALSPNCNVFKFIRKVSLDRFSSLNITILTLLVLDLLLFACASRITNPRVQEAIVKGNTILCAIFGAELLLMIVSFGPIHYWNSFYNIFETVLILLALGSLQRDSFNGLCPYANIFRLARVFRARSRYAPKKAYALDSLSAVADHWIGIFNETLESIGTYLVVLMACLYIVSVISIRLFPAYLSAPLLGGVVNATAISYRSFTTPSGATITLPVKPLISNTTLPLVHLETAWSGAVLSQYTYTYFSIAYVTNFSIGYLNSWYTFMISYTLRTQERFFWFFFVWVFLAQYIITPVLVARIIIIMDKHVSLLIRDSIDRNNDLLRRLGALRQKAQLFKYFGRLKKHASDREAAGSRGGLKAMRTEVVDVEVENNVQVHPIIAFLQERSGRHLFLFRPEGFVVWGARLVLRGWPMNVALFLAILLTVADVLAADNVSQRTTLMVESACIAIFYIEMVVCWVAHSLFLPGGYLRSPLRLLDLALNLGLLYTLAAKDRLFVPFLVLRVAKIPFSTSWFVRSVALRRLARASKKAAIPLLALMFSSLFVCFFFAVFAVQLWRYEMHSCTTLPYNPSLVYPGGLHRYANTTDFPHGCRGFFPQYAASLEWNANVDTFDNIFEACETMFRVFMMNNWGTILFLALSGDGKDVNPRFGASSAGFIYFIFAALIATIFNVLFACVIYYHYLVEVYTEGQRLIANQDVVTLNELKVSVQVCEVFAFICVLMVAFFFCHVLRRC